jgi:hypothetical protein
MAKIPQYDNPVGGLRPDEAGVTATSNAARRAGAFFNQSGRDLQQLGGETAAAGRQFASNVKSSIEDAGKVAVDYMEHQEISHGAPAFAGITDDYTNSWNTIAKNADPNDQTVANNFKVGLEQKLDEFTQSFHTKKGKEWAENRANALRTHFNEKTAADMGIRAGEAAKINAEETVNKAADTAMADPSSIGMIRENLRTTIGSFWDSSPNAKGAAAGAARDQHIFDAMKHATRAAAIGTIRQSSNPEAAIAKFASDPENAKYINVTEANTLAHSARQENRYNLAQDRAAATAEKQAQVLKANEAGSKLVSSLISPDGSVKQAGPEYFKELRRQAWQPGATPGHIEAMFNFGLKKPDRDVPTDTAAYHKVQDLILTDPQGAKMAAIQLVNAEKMSDKDFARIERTIKFLDERSPNEKDMLAAHMKSIDALYHPKGDMLHGIDPTIDALGERAVADYKRFFYPWYQQQIAADKKPAEIMKEGLSVDILKRYAPPTGGGLDAVIKLINPPKPVEKPRKTLGDIFGGGK